MHSPSYSSYLAYKSFQDKLNKIYLCRTGGDVTGDINMNCNRILDISNIIFCNGISFDGNYTLTEEQLETIASELSGNFVVLDSSGNLLNDLLFGCNLIRDLSGIYFCDGTYIGHGSSFDISTSEQLHITTTNNDVLIDSSQVSINTINNDAILNLNSKDSASCYINLKEDNITRWAIRNQGNNGDRLYFQAEGDPTKKYFTLEKTGNCGIGVSFPNERLDVCGNILARGNIDISGNNNLRFLDTKIRIGTDAGFLNQSNNAIAIGNNAGNKVQRAQAIAIGYFAGEDRQGLYAISIGPQAGKERQSDYGISIGYLAGQTDQSSNGIAIGSQAGQTNQGQNSIAIGELAGVLNQPSNTIILNATSNTINGSTSNAFYVKPIRPETDLASKKIMYYDSSSGEITYTELGSIDLSCGTINDVSGINFCDGTYIGHGSSFDISTNQTLEIKSNKTQFLSDIDMSANDIYEVKNIRFSDNSGVRIGFNSGTNSQGDYSIAIGENAGFNNQQDENIAIGLRAGFISQSFRAIAIGSNSGVTNQGNYSISVGYYSGRLDQNQNCISIGNRSGYSNQGNNSIAIGLNSGYINQGNNSIAIGNNAGNENQAVRSIILNASGVRLDNSGNTDSFYVKPIRPETDLTSKKIMYYDSSSGEITYTESGSIDLSCGTINDVSGINFCDGTYIGHGTSFDISTSEVLKINQDKIVVDTSGYIGIGTTIPSTKMHIEIDETLNAVPLKLTNINTSGSLGNVVGIQFENTGTTTTLPSAIGTNNNDIVFYTEISGNTPSEKLRLTETGDLILKPNSQSNTLSFNNISSSSQGTELPTIHNQPVSLSRITVFRNDISFSIASGNSELFNFREMYVNQLNLDISGSNNEFISPSPDISGQLVEIYTNILIRTTGNDTELQFDISSVEGAPFKEEIGRRDVRDKSTNYYLTFGPHIFIPDEWGLSEKFVFILSNTGGKELNILEQKIFFKSYYV